MKMRVSTILAALALTACGGGGSDNTHDNVWYDISGAGTASASLTYTNATGGTDQKTVVLPALVPSTGSYSIPSGQFVYISAQNQTAAGTVTVKIMVNGNTWKQATSSGAYAIATASGSCC